MSTLSVKIEDVQALDVRFPTSLELHGSDAMHKDPDYSAAYITITTNDAALTGYGFTFTLGRGTEIMVRAINSLAFFVKGRTLKSITDDFGVFLHQMVNETQLRWLGPEKGVMLMAVGGLLNAVWDLWGRVEMKPVWKLLVDMEPEQIIKLVDFTYITDFLTKEEALDILRAGQVDKHLREQEMKENGYPAYTTSAGWIGYSDEQTKELCRDLMKTGFKRFKIKVGNSLEDDKRRLKLIRELVGNDSLVMTDANQIWSVKEAIDWMIELAPYKPYWIEEPTHADDVIAHSKISEGLKPYGIKVATGENCANRIIFKQYFQANGLQVCQIDACRMGSINDCIAVILMAAKAKVPVCPHAGGLGLCEYVQHLSFFDYICVSKDLTDRMCEYATHLHEYFKEPVVVKNGNYHLPQTPGYSSEMYMKDVLAHQYPTGSVWKSLIEEKNVPQPTS